MRPDVSAGMGQEVVPQIDNDVVLGAGLGVVDLDIMPPERFVDMHC